MIYIKLVFFSFMQYLTIKCIEKCREVDGANSSSFKVPLEWTGNVHFCRVCEITFLVGGP